MNKFSLDEIQQKRDKLRKLKQFLRKKFVGIDSTIDEIVDSIEAWYLMPELLTRPTIINLWGTTGVGKTDLVESMAKYLKFDNKFTKVEIGSSTTKAYDVLDLLLTKSNVASGQHNIIFFDEFQNFRTIDQTGHEKKEAEFSDFWELLNDGKLTTKRELRELNDDYSSFTSRRKKIKDTWLHTESELLKIKALLGLDSSTQQMSEWTVGRMQKILNKHRFNAFNKLDCTKSLIIIAGNLDEAYEFSRQVDEIDLDADDYHRLSKDVNFLTVKKALTKRFKPEQIARLGNTHIVYPCLNRKAYSRLIQRVLSTVSGSFRDITGVTLKVDGSINEVVYQNGVFPTQGARPIFTTIREVVENHLPKIAVSCADTGVGSVRLCYDAGNITIHANDKVILTIPYEGRVSALKKDLSLDERTLVAVHEAGHAVVFAELFGKAPERIAIDAVSGEKKGFVKNPKIFPSKKALEYQIITMLSGMASEEAFFGENLRSTGAEADLEHATEIACEMHRVLGFYDNPYRSGYESDLSSSIQVADSHDEEIAKAMREFAEKAANLISERKALVTDIAATLLKVRKLTEADFIKICKAHGLVVTAESEIYPKYHDLFKDFLHSEE